MFIDSHANMESIFNLDVCNVSILNETLGRIFYAWDINIFDIKVNYVM